MRKVMLTLLFIFITTPLTAEIVDEQDRELEYMLNHLAQVSDALRQARAQVNLAKQSKSTVRFNYEKLIADISKIEKEVNSLIAPKTQRMQYKTLIPDSVYFMPYKQETDNFDRKHRNTQEKEKTK